MGKGNQNEESDVENGGNNKVRQKRVEKTTERIKMEQFMSKFETLEKVSPKKDYKKKKSNDNISETIRSPNSPLQQQPPQPQPLQQPSPQPQYNQQPNLPLQSQPQQYNQKPQYNQQQYNQIQIQKQQHQQQQHFQNQQQQYQQFLQFQQYQQQQQQQKLQPQLQANKYSTITVPSTSTSTTPSISLSSSPTNSPKFHETPSSPNYPLSFPPLSPVITSTFFPLPPISPTPSSQSLPPLISFLNSSDIIN